MRLFLRGILTRATIPRYTFAFSDVGRRRPLSAESFDAFRAVDRHEVRTGTLDAHDLPRVIDHLAFEEGKPDDLEAPVTWTLTGGRSADGRAALTLQLTGTLPLTCQRCLQTMDWPLEHSSVLLLARNEAEVEALDAASEQEVVLAADPVDPHALIEDELLLTIPFVPRHPGSCPPVVEA